MALFEILYFRKEKLGEKIYENYIIDCQNFVYKQTMSNLPLHHYTEEAYLLCEIYVKAFQSSFYFFGNGLYTF